MSNKVKPPLSGHLWEGEVWRHVTMVALFLDDNKTNDDGDGRRKVEK